jgi:hypothetical protein
VFSCKIFRSSNIRRARAKPSRALPADRPPDRCRSPIPAFFPPPWPFDEHSTSLPAGPRKRPSNARVPRPLPIARRTLAESSLSAPTSPANLPDICALAPWRLCVRLGPETPFSRRNTPFPADTRRKFSRPKVLDEPSTSPRTRPAQPSHEPLFRPPPRPLKFSRPRAQPPSRKPQFFGRITYLNHPSVLLLGQFRESLDEPSAMVR